MIGYRITGAAAFSFACHCTDCQQRTSIAFSMGFAIEKSRSELTNSPARSRGWATLVYARP
nr:GFA family protein [uncultured Lichenicoccus sp.]